MKLNYKKLLRQIDEAGACMKNLRAFAYFVEHEMYEEAREPFGWHTDGWLVVNGIIKENWYRKSWKQISKQLGIKRIITYHRNNKPDCYTIDENGRLSTEGADEIVNDPKYTIPEDYVYKRIGTS